MTLKNSKTKYYFKVANKLFSKELNQKCYWSILKSFLNSKKIPCIPPIIRNNNFIINIREKSESFYIFIIFPRQCSLIENSSTLTTCIFLKTDKSKIYFFEEGILKIVRSNKAHSHDNISTRMIKLCDLSLVWWKEFSLLWKMANVVPAHKKNDKRSIKNYPPVSPLSIFGEIFECLLLNQMYCFFLENNLISLNQSGFWQSGSCINQLISITHEVYWSVDPGYKVCGVFSDISKAFDKVWHKGLLHKLKENGINGALLNVLDPLHFLIYISDPCDRFHSNPKLFADNTSLFWTVHNIAKTTNQLGMDLPKKSIWAHQWKMLFNF